MGQDETLIARIERELRAFGALFRRNRLLGLAVGVIALGYLLYLCLPRLPPRGRSPDPPAGPQETLKSVLTKEEVPDKRNLPGSGEEPPPHIVGEVTKDGKLHNTLRDPSSDH